MAREHARILVGVWVDNDWRNRSPEAQRLYFLLLSQRNINNAGVLPLMVSKWARGSTTTTIDDIEKALAELAEHRYVVIDTDTQEVLVRTFIRNDGVAKQPNVLKSALKQARQIESTLLRQALAHELRRLDRTAASEVANELDPNHSETLQATPPEPIGNPKGSVDNPVDKNPSRTPPEPIAQGWGEGEGEGVISSPVVTHLGGSRAHPREEPPPPRCPKHLEHPTDQPCRACGDARRTRERFDAEHAEHRALIANAIDQARNDPRLRCHHGTDGGLYPHPDTGQSATCALCRTEQTRSPT